MNILLNLIEVGLRCSFVRVLMEEDISIYPEFYVLKEDESPFIFGPIVIQRWSYACAKQLIESLIVGQ
jgi:hypothetical protein